MTPAAGPLAETLRAARKARGLSIAQLATLAEVSPRLISEVERGRRAHVSYETAVRLLQLVGVAVIFEAQSQRDPAADAARVRAEQRRSRWTGEQSTLRQQAPPPAPASAVARLEAVADASRLAVGLRRASHATAGARSRTSTA